jgi:GDP-L-fucose synthase
MKVMITGTGGFVGRNLAEGLTDKYEVLSPRSSELDLTDYKAVERYIADNKVEHIVHAAVHSALTTDRDAGFQIDLRMLVNLTRNLDKLKKLIVFGSGAEFAKTRDIKKVTEEQWGEYVPEDLYGLSKFITTEIVRREPKMINLRLFGIYGPHEDYRYKFISNAIVKNLLGLPIKIKLDVVFDYLYVTDLVEVVDYFLSHESNYRDYNVTPKESIRISELVKLINEVAEQKSEMELVNPNLNFEYTGNNARIIQEMPNWHITSYREGIQKLYNYYKSIQDKLDARSIREDEFLKRSKTTSGKAVISRRRSKGRKKLTV